VRTPPCQVQWQARTHREARSHDDKQIALFLKDFSLARDYTKQGTRSKAQTGEEGFEGGANKSRQNDVLAGGLTKWETDTLKQVGRRWWAASAYWQIAALARSFVLTRRLLGSTQCFSPNINIG
jgi:hypothetical protein